MTTQSQWSTKSYVLELGGAMAIYGVFLVGSNLIEKAVHPQGLPLLALNLAPMIGIVLAAWAIIRGFGRMDELGRRIQYEALLLSFLGTAIISIGWGFLEDMGIPQFQAHFVWPLMCAQWALALIYSTLKYR